jgi:hypothetical protein
LSVHSWQQMRLRSQSVSAAAAAAVACVLRCWLLHVLLAAEQHGAVCWRLAHQQQVLSVHSWQQMRLRSQSVSAAAAAQPAWQLPGQNEVSTHEAGKGHSIGSFYNPFAMVLQR